MTTYKHPCDRCTGNKTIKSYSHVAGGVCFKCMGKGYVVSNKKTVNKRFEVTAIFKPDNTRCVIGYASATTADKAIALILQRKTQDNLSFYDLSTIKAL